MSAAIEAIRSALRCGKSGCPCYKSANVHCPSHTDPVPSLTVHESPDGKPLVNCKGGCSQESVIVELKKRNLWPEVGRDRENGRVHLPTDEPVAIYEYRTASGELVAVKGRFEPRLKEKYFRWRLPAASGWSGLEGMPLVSVPLWGAELLKTQPDAPVFLVEGEKAAMAVRAGGFLAVTHGGGASIKDFGSSLDVLRGRHVVLWPDNDDPGRAYMDRARRALNGVASTTVTIFPPLPEKGDAFDYFASGQTADDLRRLVPPPPRPVMDFLTDTQDDGCKFRKLGVGYRVEFIESDVGITIEHLRRSSGELRGEVLVEGYIPTLPTHLYWGGLILSSGANREKLGKILEKRTKGLPIDWDGILEVVCRKVALAEREGEPFTTAGDMETTLGATDWLITDLCPRLEATTIYGDGGVGKSMLALAMGLTVLTGTEIVPGYAPAQRGNVLYLDWEASRARIDSRVKRLCAGASIKPVSVGYRRCVVPMVDQADDVLRYCQSEGVVLVIVDSAEMAMNGTGGEGGDPNDKVIRLHAALRTLGATVIIVDHVSADRIGRAGGAGKPIGGVFKRNLSRMTHELRKSLLISQPGQMEVGLFNTKRNDDGALLPAVSLLIEFGSTWTRYYRGGTAQDTSDLHTGEKMALALRKYGRLTLGQMANETGCTLGSIKTQLTRDKGGTFSKVGRGLYELVKTGDEQSGDAELVASQEIPF